MPLKASNAALIAGAAVAGCGLLAYYLPRAHPAASWNIRVDRQQSIVKAREISAALGVDTSKWEATVSGGTDGKRGYYLRRHPDDATARRFTPVNARVT